MKELSSLDGGKNKKTTVKTGPKPVLAKKEKPDLLLSTCHSAPSDRGRRRGDPVRQECIPACGRSRGRSFYCVVCTHCRKGLAGKHRRRTTGTVLWFLLRTAIDPPCCSSGVFSSGTGEPSPWPPENRPRGTPERIYRMHGSINSTKILIKRYETIYCNSVE